MPRPHAAQSPADRPHGLHSSDKRPPGPPSGSPLAPPTRRQTEKRAPGGRGWDAFPPGRREASQGLCEELKAEGCGGRGRGIRAPELIRPPPPPPRPGSAGGGSGRLGGLGGRAALGVRAARMGKSLVAPAAGGDGAARREEAPCGANLGGPGAGIAFLPPP